MLVSLNWIKEFVKLGEVSPVEFGRRFTMATAEIEGIHAVNLHLEKIRVVEIEKIEQHPNADKLNLVTFKVSANERKQVVCGASNVKVGMRVPYAPLGTEFPSGLKLEPKAIRGIVSEGMLCSKSELGLEEKSEGLMELPKETQLGMTMSQYLSIHSDVIIDIDNKSLTHRPDLWGHYGLAREFATVFDEPLEKPFNDKWHNNILSNISGGKSPIVPIVDKNSSCLGYMGVSIDNVKVSESPSWIKDRLVAVGLRPINNIVDISNYVMLELGIPLHIFDREKISGDKIYIKRAQDNEKFKTLDEVERNLTKDDTVICDQDKTLVLAGVMGGLESGVSESTNKIFIEVANWKAAEVRKTSTRIGLRTDSSVRYEKTLDSLLLKRTMLRTIEMVLKICPEAKCIGGLEYDGPSLDDIAPLVISTSVDKIVSVLGITIPVKKIIDILEALDFKVKNIGEDDLEITVPSFRATKDIEFEEDLIEEIGRVIGYDNIEPVAPYLKVKPVHLSNAQKLHRKLKNFLVYQANCFEVMTYPLIGEKLNQKAQYPTLNEMKLVNAISEDHDRMRINMIPNVLDVVSLNAKNFNDFKTFELGRVYQKGNDGSPVERSCLALCFFHKDENQFLKIVDNTEKMLNAIDIPFDLVEKNPKFQNSIIDQNWIGLHPHEFYNIKIMGQYKGAAFSIHPYLLRELKIKGNCSVVLIDLSSFENNDLKERRKYKPLPKFPGAKFDCTVLSPSNESVMKVYEAMRKLKVKEITDCKIIDIYPLNDSFNSVTVRTYFMDQEKTLSSDVIKQIESNIISHLEKANFKLKQ